MEVTQIKKVDLKKILETRGMTLYQLSKLSHVNYSYIHRAMNGYVKLSEDAYNKIKKFL